MRVFILSILLFLTSCSSAPSGRSLESSNNVKTFYSAGKTYQVGYTYTDYIENYLSQYRKENYCSRGIFLISYSSSEKKFTNGGNLQDAKTERICITEDKILALYTSRPKNNSKWDEKSEDLDCWDDGERMLSKNSPNIRGNRSYDACNSQFAIIDTAETATINLGVATFLVGLPILFDPTYLLPSNYKNHYRFFSPNLLFEAVKQSGILMHGDSLKRSKQTDSSLRKSQNPSINNQFRRPMEGEEYSYSVKRVKRKLTKLNYFDGIISFAHDSDLNDSLTAFLSDEGFCSFASNPSRIKKTEILLGDYCKYYFTGTLWIPFQSEAIIESKKLDDLLNSAILRIRE